MKKSESYKGYETWSSAMMMSLKMYMHISLAFVAAQLSLTFFISYFYYFHPWKLTLNFLWNSLVNFDLPMIDTALGATYKLLLKSIEIFFMITPIWLIFPFVLKKFKARAEEQSADKYLRGSRLITLDDLNKQIKKSGKDTYLQIGRVSIPTEAEVEHFLIAGRTGVGKTVLLSSIVDKIRERQGKAVIYDAEGTYLSRFYNPDNDIIINPIDARGKGWTIFNDVTSIMDFDTIAESLIPIPTSSNQDPFWNRAAQDVFVSILRSLYIQKREKATNMDIYKAVFEDRKTLSRWFQSQFTRRGYRHLEETGKGDRVGSIFSVMSQYTKSFEYVSQNDGDFSITNWLQDEKPGFIFIVNTEKSKETLKPILSLFIDQLSQKILLLPESFDRRIYLLLDEFPSLQKLPSITNLLTRGRKRGASAWIGIQDVAQLEKVYGREEAKTILDNCSSCAIFACSDDYSAEHLSRRIGDTEVLRIDQNLSMGVEDERDGVTLSSKEIVKRLVMASEIINLPKLNLYLKISGYDITKTVLSFKNYLNPTEPFILKDIFTLNNLIDTDEPLANALDEEKAEDKAEEKAGREEREAGREAGKEDKAEEKAGKEEKAEEKAGKEDSSIKL